VATFKGSAPAKVNLSLHVIGQQDDSYHLLDSLVCFAGIYDEITASASVDLRLTVKGPFAQGVPASESNLVLRAARALQAARGVNVGAQLTLEKNLPHAAGLGSGSSDAAMTLAILAQLWKVAPLSANAPEVLALGADVPVCMMAPNPTRMEGIGELLTPCPSLPNAALVLVNPRVSVPTKAVFEGLVSKQNPIMGEIPPLRNFDALAKWVSRLRNDLEPPARALAPQVDEAIKALSVQPLVAHAAMSGSGATCFGLTRSMGDARQVARALQVAHMDWWVAPAELL